MPNPADELYEIYNRQSNMKEVVLELDFEPKPPGGITALAIQRAGVGRSYTATFELHDLEALVFYAGEGEGLAGEHVGKVAFAPLLNLMALLAEQAEVLADGYHADATFSYTPGTLFDAWLMIQRGDQKRVILSSDREGPPLLRVALLLLDLLLDQAIWEGEPFTIQRAPPTPDYGRQKR